MSDYRIHPAFGILTDPEEIRIFDRQQEQEMYERMYEESMMQQMYEEEMRAYEEAYNEAMYADYWMYLVFENETITESN